MISEFLFYYDRFGHPCFTYNVCGNTYAVCIESHTLSNVQDIEVLLQQHHLVINWEDNMISLEGIKSDKIERYPIDFSLPNSAFNKLVSALKENLPERFLRRVRLLTDFILQSRHIRYNYIVDTNCRDCVGTNENLLDSSVQYVRTHFDRRAGFVSHMFKTRSDSVFFVVSSPSVMPSVDSHALLNVPTGFESMISKKINDEINPTYVRHSGDKIHLLSRDFLHSSAL